ncbi:GNAT family N-acetyltransferase [Allopusillimonas ginsengisoli]|uniref:GNAT family N-acetyltransferase n=1 Tax=Allopusillimonas ginsengisoli TaxID=453575 RepID=UPI001FD6FAA5|nr:GNAT family N-acetyltransferase [Allopusillimonas ginsengisoli]
MPITFTLSSKLDSIDPQQWNALAGPEPFLQHAFLLALDQTGCATRRTGWSPEYLLMHRDGALVGAMPLYLKSHSRGEYVFDHAWARAFEEHGLPYYPKLLCAVPFTPVPGPRLLASEHDDRVALARHAIQIARQNNISSLHILFPAETDQPALAQAGYMFRENVQFHWFNRGYRTLDDFLASLNQQKRKKLKQDSKKTMQAGVSFRWLRGAQIDAQALSFFYRCYQQTYLEHGNLPYLNQDFFERLYRTLPDALVIIQAEREGEPIASALNLLGNNTLYGRYWGSVAFVPGLHFETCYLQGIAFCIHHGIASFEGGAQGEHKLSRGMLPVRTRSAHWISDQRFSAAIDDYLARETPAVDAYIEALHDHSPYRKQDGG